MQGRAGVGRADITPRGDVILEGYHRDEVTAAVLDPLYVTALYLEADAQPVLLVSVDAICFLIQETTPLRRAAGEAAGVLPERVLICYTHTHSSPRATPEYLALVRSAVARASADARASAQEARAGWGLGKARAGVCRRPRTSDGLAYHGADPTRSVDTRVGVLRLDDSDDRPLARLVWHGTHGNALRGDSNAVSADWPGACRKVLEDEEGCPALVLMGAAGNVNPIWRGSVAAMERTGRTVAEEALGVIRRIKTAPLARVDARREEIPLRLEPLPEGPEAERIAAEALEHWEVAVDEWRARVRALRDEGLRQITLPLEVAMLRINDGALGGIPMEPFCEIAMNVSARVPGHIVLFGGLVNGWIGYLPVPEEYASGGYEVRWAPAVYGPASGWLMPAVPETAREVVSAAQRLLAALFR